MRRNFEGIGLCKQLLILGVVPAFVGGVIHSGNVVAKVFGGNWAVDGAMWKGMLGSAVFLFAAMQMINLASRRFNIPQLSIESVSERKIRTGVLVTGGYVAMLYVSAQLGTYMMDGNVQNGNNVFIAGLVGILPTIVRLGVITGVVLGICGLYHCIKASCQTVAENRCYRAMPAHVETVVAPVAVVELTNVRVQPVSSVGPSRN